MHEKEIVKINGFVALFIGAIVGFFAFMLLFMLQRQQAQAILSARKIIVDGAVTMVKSAIDQLSEQQVIDLDDEKKAHMVNNLLVALVSENGTQPIVNTGSMR